MINVEWVFPITAGILVIVEIMLIIAVRDLTKSIKKLNAETQDKFNYLVEEITKKFKGLVDLAVAFGKTKEKRK
ncbi:MAG: hypothetical protein WCV90_08940 [Candidatus Woesearchaeota archaeon]|jgi:hypothetical protein